MLSRKSLMRAGALLSVAAVVALTAVLVLPRHSSAAPPPTGVTVSALSSQDIATVQSFGPMLSNSHGVSVSVVKAPGATVWSDYFPTDSVGPETETIKGHDLLVVVSQVDVPQGLRHTRPGDTPVVISTVRLVIDATDGRLIATTTSTADQSPQVQSALTQLATASTVTVN